MTTTTKGTIKYKISFEKPLVTKGAAESIIKEKKRQLLFATIANISSDLNEKTEIFGMSTQFKSINEALALFLKMSIGT